MLVMLINQIIYKTVINQQKMKNKYVNNANKVNKNANANRIKTLLNKNVSKFLVLFLLVEVQDLAKYLLLKF